MKQTKIQWCHSTINPVMGCGGCELWPGPEKVITKLEKELGGRYILPPDTDLRTLITEVVDDRELSEIYTDREAIAAELVARLKLEKAAIGVVVDLVREACKCYAGIIGTFRAGHKGYAEEFTQPKLFPGRMAAAANWGPPTAAERATKPWLLDAPRMIFVSDMGDALSCIVSFPYLKQEIVDVVTSEKGRRHLWLWLTKRPARMAEFGRWLADQNIQWPDNLVAMTTITSQATAGRIAELRKVPSKLKGLSCEPVFGELNLDLTGIDWCIAGGGSDVLAETFHIEWALSLRGQCRKSGTAFFLKQLGKNPVFNGQPLKLKHRHGGNWDEWPADWRTREIPDGFRIRL